MSWPVCVHTFKVQLDPKRWCEHVLTLWMMYVRSGMQMVYRHGSDGYRS